MAVKDEFSGNEKISQNLRYDDVAEWIEVKHTINLGVRLDADLETQKTYNQGDTGYSNLCTTYEFTETDKYPITVYTYKEIHGTSNRPWVKTFNDDIGDVPHHVVIKFYNIDTATSSSATSTTSGTAL